MAVPSEEPRFETLRDRPEISPWSRSGKADWTTLTEEVSMTPTPAPIRNRPGMKSEDVGCGACQQDQQQRARDGRDESAR